MDTRKQLLASAEMLIALHGPEGFSLRELARRSGQRNSAALQYHFCDRAGLIQAWLRWRLGEINRCSKRLPPAPADADLHALLEQLVLPFVMALQERLANDGSSHTLRCLARLDPPPLPVRQTPSGAGWRNALQETWSTLHARLPIDSADWRLRLLWPALTGGLAQLEKDSETEKPTAATLPAQTALLIDCLTGLLQGRPAATPPH